MNKFMNVDLIESLGATMRQNTGFFQSDFEIDKEILKEEKFRFIDFLQPLQVSNLDIILL